MPRLPSLSRVALVLVVGSLVGCSTTRPPSPSPVAAATPTAPPTTGPSRPAPSSPRTGTPAHRVIAGPAVAGAFDAATDGTVIAWSSGAVDADAPELWAFDPATGRSTLVYRSTVDGAILANVAVRHGSFAFAEVTPRADGSRTWRFELVDANGAVTVLDTNDVPPTMTGILPMAAVSDHGILWATTHGRGGEVLDCELRYAALADLRPRVIEREPCDRTEVWYPRSDGTSFVYGTVEYGPDGTGDDRHVYLLADADLAHPRRLDRDGEASLPNVLADTVVWKTAPRDFNMLNGGDIVEHSLAAAASRPVDLAGGARGRLTIPTIGPGFYAAESDDSAIVRVWDRATSRAVEIDHLDPADPGFLSGVRLAGDILIWFYTSTTQGGGVREIRWLELPAP